MTQTYSREQITSGEHSLSPQEAELLLNSCEDFTEKMLLKIALSCGIRRIDISKLAWKDIDWEENRIKFYEHKKRRTKEVYFDDNLKTELKQLRNIHKEEHYLFPGRSEPKYGKGHISDKTAYNILQRNLDAAGISKRPFHSLRATCAKLCKEKGWSVEQIAKHLGDTVRVVQQHYSTPSLSEMKNIAQDKGVL